MQFSTFSTIFSLFWYNYKDFDYSAAVLSSSHVTLQPLLCVNVSLAYIHLFFLLSTFWKFLQTVLHFIELFLVSIQSVKCYQAAGCCCWSRYGWWISCSVLLFFFFSLFFCSNFSNKSQRLCALFSLSQHYMSNYIQLLNNSNRF